MAKRKYRAIWIKEVDGDELGKRLSAGSVCVAAIDVAKTDMFAAFVDSSGQVQITVKWKHPAASAEFLSLVKKVAGFADVEIAMEPSGTFGDALRYLMQSAGFKVYRVNPKHTNDAKEIYDSVPLRGYRELTPFCS
jgi:hypothetical protein